jgi:hypothetical protein
VLRLEPGDPDRAQEVLSSFDDKVHSATIVVNDIDTNRFVDAVPDTP